MLGKGRFLKTVLCVHDTGGLVVVKVFYKREDVPDLRPYAQQLLVIRWGPPACDDPCNRGAGAGTTSKKPGSGSAACRICHAGC